MLRILRLSLPFHGFKKHLCGLLEQGRPVTLLSSVCGVESMALTPAHSLNLWPEELGQRNRILKHVYREACPKHG